jgi:hypothetical protein
MGNRTKSKIAKLREHGFDRSYYSPRTGTWFVKCSQCEAVVINGYPTHEHGCPNSKTNPVKK